MLTASHAAIDPHGSHLDQVTLLICCACAGLLAALSCIRIPQHDVHLFGFNWSPKSYYMHKMTSEELIARELILQYRMTVHKPACEALYSCDPKCDSSGYRASIDGTGDDCTLRVSAAADCHSCCDTCHASAPRHVQHLQQGIQGCTYTTA